jgi:hypothetical protein
MKCKKTARWIGAVAATAGLTVFGVVPAALADGVTITPSSARPGTWVLVTAGPTCKGHATAQSAAFVGSVVSLGNNGVGSAHVSSSVVSGDYKVTVVCATPQVPLFGYLTVVRYRPHRPTPRPQPVGPETGGGGMAAEVARNSAPATGRGSVPAPILVGGLLVVGALGAGGGLMIRRRRSSGRV